MYGNVLTVCQANFGPGHVIRYDVKSLSRAKCSHLHRARAQKSC